MVRHTLKILQHLPQNFQSVSDHFGRLCIKEIKYLFKTNTKGTRTKPKGVVALS